MNYQVQKQVSINPIIGKLRSTCLFDFQISKYFKIIINFSITSSCQLSIINKLVDVLLWFLFFVLFVGEELELCDSSTLSPLKALSLLLLLTVYY
eukprot:m.8791 g.8791  ORF g.8791 m.8791 type:complete len:95 (-) comp3956_c0_seq2:17-301(-)